MEVTQATFESEVLQASSAVPVLVDFWAPWCAPCRAIGPILEKLERDYAGAFKLAKVNSDENAELAARYGVRSIPNVIAFRGGKPAAHFLGALPESQVRAFIDRLADLERLERAAALIDAGDAEGAERLLEAIAPDAELDARREALLAAARFSRARPAEQGELEARLAADPDDLEARLALAQRYAAARCYREAMDQLVAIVRKDKAWRDGEARRQLVHLFTLAGEQPELVSEYRRKLATALY
ncbi:MAG TPA: thioredoxin [Burkholderiales bacterium]|nr:thioredoxin [Burkholderiales bacterium]